MHNVEEGSKVTFKKLRYKDHKAFKVFLAIYHY